MKYHQIKSNAKFQLVEIKINLFLKEKSKFWKTWLSKLGCYRNFNVEVHFSNWLMIHKENTKGNNVFFLLIFAPLISPSKIICLRSSKDPGGGGGDTQMKQTGMHVGNF